MKRVVAALGLLHGPWAAIGGPAAADLVVVRAGRLIDPKAGAAVAGAIVVIDASVNPHGLNARQFAWQVRYGQTPMEAIRSATLSAAELIGKEKEMGSLEPGKWADLVAVKGDPLADVRVLETSPS